MLALENKMYIFISYAPLSFVNFKDFEALGIFCSPRNNCLKALCLVLVAEKFIQFTVNYDHVNITVDSIHKTLKDSTKTS